MTRRVCYLERADRGDRLSRVRLAGEAGDEAYELPRAGEDAAAVLQQIRGAAEWTAQRLVQGEGPRAGLRMVCLDVEGSRCEWVTLHGSDDALVEAAVGQAEGWGEGGSPRTLGGVWATPSRDESTLQALRNIEAKRAKGKHAEDDGTRSAALCVPDVSARHFLDALDELGIGVDRVVSLWHAAAIAWDPAGAAAPGQKDSSAEVVASASPTTGVILIDPAGRAVWAWSRGGELLCGGSMRLNAETGGMPSVEAPEISRLMTEWLAWAAQLGVAPSRVVCITPGLGEGGAGGLSTAELGEMLGRMWPEATIDLAVNEDPLGSTLQRLARMDAPSAGLSRDRRHSMVALTHRPGRSHRALYVWAAAGLVALSAGVLAVSWRAWMGAKSARAQAAAIRTEMGEKVLPLVPPNNPIQAEIAKDNPDQFMMELVNKKRAEVAPASGVEAPMPVLKELAALSFIIGNSEVEIEDINVSQFQVTVELSVPDTQTADFVKEALDSDRDTRCTWSRLIASTPRKPGKVSMTLTGQWKRDAGEPLGGKP